MNNWINSMIGMPADVGTYHVTLSDPMGNTIETVINGFYDGETWRYSEGGREIGASGFFVLAWQPLVKSYEINHNLPEGSMDLLMRIEALDASINFNASQIMKSAGLIPYSTIYKMQIKNLMLRHEMMACQEKLKSKR